MSEGIRTAGDDRPVAVLCAAAASVYKRFHNVEVYDLQRDARSFTGGMPSGATGGLVTIRGGGSAEVWQAWWGYPMRKATWLYFAGIASDAVQFPLRLHPQGGDRRAEQLMSHQQRSATNLEFASWLLTVTRCSDVTKKQLCPTN